MTGKDMRMLVVVSLQHIIMPLFDFILVSIAEDYVERKWSNAY